MRNTIFRRILFSERLPVGNEHPEFAHVLGLTLIANVLGILVLDAAYYGAHFPLSWAVASEMAAIFIVGTLALWFAGFWEIGAISISAGFALTALGVSGTIGPLSLPCIVFGFCLALRVFSMGFMRE